MLDYIQISYIEATLTAIIGMVATALWVLLEEQVSDLRVRQFFAIFTLVVLLFTSSEIVYLVRKVMMPELSPSLEYFQYVLVVSGFLAFLFAMKIGEEMTSAYGFGSETLQRKIAALTKKREAAVLLRQKQAPTAKEMQLTEKKFLAEKTVQKRKRK